MTVVFLSATPAFAAQFGAVLTGPFEVPPTSSDGHGTGTVILDAAHTGLQVTMQWEGLTGAITGVHLHEKTPGQNAGGVVVSLVPFVIDGDRVAASVSIDEALGDRIATNPSSFYLNVHTAQNPNGEIRGDLTPRDTTVMWSGALRGSNEVPPSGSDAVGAFVITLDAANHLTVDVNAGSLQGPMLAHIHTGAAGVNGGVLIALASSASDFSNGRVAKTFDLTEELAGQLRANPMGFYVNVHTAAFPNGEIRGQIQPITLENDVAIVGKVSNGIGQNFVTDVRIFNPSKTNSAALLEYFSGSSSHTTATATLAVDVPPQGTAILDDFAGVLGVTGVGALRVTSASNLIVTSRIFNDQRANGAGTFGQFVPAIPRANVSRGAVLPQLSNQPATRARTNLGIFNPNDAEVFLRLAVQSPDGDQFSSRTLVIPPLSHQQTSIADYFQSEAITADDLTVTYDASAPLIVYASVIDSGSSDQVFVPPQTGVPPPEAQSAFVKP